MDNLEYIQTKRVPAEMDVRAPDTSEIRLLANMKGGSTCHCTLPPQGVSLAGVHKTVEEVWYCIEGHGQVWRKWQDHELEVDFLPGVCLTIPPGTHFQFRCVGDAPLRFIITTMPPWPGEQEWSRVAEHW